MSLQFLPFSSFTFLPSIGYDGICLQERTANIVVYNIHTVTVEQRKKRKGKNISLNNETMDPSDNS